MIMSIYEYGFVNLIGTDRIGPTTQESSSHLLLMKKKFKWMEREEKKRPGKANVKSLVGCLITNPFLYN